MKKEFIIFDTEFTTWEGAMARHWSGEKEYREIVQIAAIKVDRETLTETDSFDILIKPTINPVLSDFFVELTGITQQEVDTKGVSFEEGVKAFYAYSENYTACSYGNDAMIIAENMALVKCFDLSMYRTYFYNFRTLFETADPQSHKCSSGELAGYLDLDLAKQAQVHNALYDCRSLLAALKHYTEAGKIKFVA